MSKKKTPDEKIGNVAPFGLRMLPALKARLEEATNQSGRSLNSEIVGRLESSFDPVVSVPKDIWDRISRAAGRLGMSPQDKVVETLANAYPPPVAADEVVKEIRQYISILKAGAREQGIAMLLSDLHSLADDIAEGRLEVKENVTAQEIAERVRRYEAHGGAPGWEHMPVDEAFDDNDRDAVGSQPFELEKVPENREAVKAALEFLEQTGQVTRVASPAKTAAEPTKKSRPK